MQNQGTVYSFTDIAFMSRRDVARSLLKSVPLASIGSSTSSSFDLSKLWTAHDEKATYIAFYSYYACTARLVLGVPVFDPFKIMRRVLRFQRDKVMLVESSELFFPDKLLMFRGLRSCLSMQATSERFSRWTLNDCFEMDLWPN